LPACSFSLFPGKENEIILDAVVPNLRNISIAIVLVILMLTVAGVLRRRR
jgi:hypothetical protein